MAFTVVNPSGPIKITRGRAWNLSAVAGSGTLTATGQAVEFTPGYVDLFNQRKLVVQAVGTITSPTGLLEASNDGGTTWFVVPALTSDLTVTGAADTAPAFVARYEISGISSALYRFGFTAGTFTGGTSVWVAVD